MNSEGTEDDPGNAIVNETFHEETYQFPVGRMVRDMSKRLHWGSFLQESGKLVPLGVAGNTEDPVQQVTGRMSQGVRT